MNRFFFLLFLFTLSTVVYSQNEIKGDSLVIKHVPQNEIYKDPVIYQEPLINSVDTELENRGLYDKSEIKAPNYLNLGLKLTPDLKSRKLSSTLSYSLHSYDYNYGIGNYLQGGIELNYKPLDKLIFSFGGYNVNYNILHSRYNDIVVNYNAAYEFTDWMHLSVSGQNSTNSVKNARFGGYMFAPQTSYGSVLRFKTSEKVDLNVGVERVFNSLTKNWETQGILGPTIRLK